MPIFSVSVIICTVDRSQFLRKVMDELAGWRSVFQELIVVAGPAKDDTERVLLDNEHLITKTIFTKCRNVSVARNLGLRAATQDIVLYLDDDVIPSTEWISHHVSAHQMEGARCGCVAGAVVDRTRSEAPLQFSRGVGSRLSESRPVLSAQQAQRYVSRSDWFAGAMGANASYKREALLRVGGFDEFFEYFLEETDICLRLVESGYTVQPMDCTVNHYVQPSHNRFDRRHLTCWYALAKNTTYFALKHRKQWVYCPVFLMRLTMLLVHRCLLRILRLRLTHGLSMRVLLGYMKEMLVGVSYGWRGGLRFRKLKRNADVAARISTRRAFAHEAIGRLVRK